jgi:hypothetical protein
MTEGKRMRKRTLVGIALLVLAQGLSGCGGTDDAFTPVAPSPVPSQAARPTVRPGSWTDRYTLTAVSLSGVVYELTPTGRVPIAGARVYCELCGTETHTFASADANGFYIFPGDLASGGGVWLSTALTPIFVENSGYRDPIGLPPFSGVCPPGFSCREVLIDGDTRFDIELVRR